MRGTDMMPRALVGNVRKDRGVRWLPLVGWVLLLFGISSIPDLSVPGSDTPGLDKVFHFAEYAVLGALLGYAARLSEGRRTLWIGALAGLLVGTLDELYQSTVPGRSLDAMDAAADTMGTMVGALAWFAWTRRKRRTMLS
jgi:uncharacterized protein YfiM (DUF2279 family)